MRVKLRAVPGLKALGQNRWMWVAAEAPGRRSAGSIPAECSEVYASRHEALAAAVVAAQAIIEAAAHDENEDSEVFVEQSDHGPNFGLVKGKRYVGSIKQEAGGWVCRLAPLDPLKAQWDVIGTWPSLESARIAIRIAWHERNEKLKLEVKDD